MLAGNLVFWWFVLVWLVVAGVFGFLWGWYNTAYAVWCGFLGGDLG